MFLYPKVQSGQLNEITRDLLTVNSFSLSFYPPRDIFMAPEETAGIARLARVCLGLIVSSFAITVAGGILLSIWDGKKTVDSVLTISGIVVSGAVGIGASLIFWMNEGCESQHTYLGFLLPLLYVCSLIVTYLCVKLAIFFSTDMTKEIQAHKARFVVISIWFWLSAAGQIISTLRLPRLVSFLRDFRKLPRSAGVRLSEWIFPKHYSEVYDDEVNDIN